MQHSPSELDADTGNCRLVAVRDAELDWDVVGSGQAYQANEQDAGKLAGSFEGHGFSVRQGDSEPEADGWMDGQTEHSGL